MHSSRNRNKDQLSTSASNQWLAEGTLDDDLIQGRGSNPEAQLEFSFEGRMTPEAGDEENDPTTSAEAETKNYFVKLKLKMKPMKKPGTAADLQEMTTEKLPWSPRIFSTPTTTGRRRHGAESAAIESPTIGETAQGYPKHPTAGITQDLSSEVLKEDKKHEAAAIPSTRTRTTRKRTVSHATPEPPAVGVTHDLDELLAENQSEATIGNGTTIRSLDLQEDTTGRSADEITQGRPGRIREDLLEAAIAAGKITTTRGKGVPPTVKKGKPTVKAHRHIVALTRVKDAMKKITSDRISKPAVAYAGAVAEYLIAELLDTSGLEAQKNKRKRIQPSDIRNAIAKDPEMFSLLSTPKQKVIVPMQVGRQLPKRGKQKTTKVQEKVDTVLQQTEE